jgi:dolichyl-phosphate beta-glucosyltransferase
VTDQNVRLDRPWLEIIVPARNEQARLPSGLAELCVQIASLPLGAEVIVVDSASSDLTSAIVRDWPSAPVPVRLIRTDRPGKGTAVRTGLLATRAPFVGFCDADMATDLAAIDDAIRHLRAGHQVVVGSRSHADAAVEVRHSPVRVAGAAVFRAMARMLVPGVGDTQCGFKFFAGPLVRQAAADLRATGFAFDIELLARCRQLGGEVLEIPVTWRDVPGSTFSIRRHSLTAFAEIGVIKLALRSPSAWDGAETEAEAEPAAQSSAAQSPSAGVAGAATAVGPL